MHLHIAYLSGFKRGARQESRGVCNLICRSLFHYYSVPPCIDASPVDDTNLRFYCLYFRWACIDQVSHKTYINRDDLHKGSKQSSTRYTKFLLVTEIKLTSFLGSNLYGDYSASTFLPSMCFLPSVCFFYILS